LSKSTRIFELVHLLGGRRSRTVREIADKLDISERTVFRYLADLQDRHIPIYRDDQGYRLLETATLKPLNLTAEEHALLKVALDNPALRRHPSLDQRLTALELKLDAAIALAEESPRALQLASIDRSGPQAEEAIEPLRLAIQRRQTVAIRYDSLSGGRHDWRRVDPWQVFQRSEAWYLVGRCHVHDQPRIFRLDRISGIRGSRETFELPADFCLDHFLEGSWKIFTGDGRYRVHLRFDKSLAPLILNARHHPGEEVRKRRDGSVDYRVELSSLEEIARWVVGFGGKCHVVGPEVLDRSVRSLAAGVMAAV
jgi:predicted DNA-binding transcriptional regulator YafY